MNEEVIYVEGHGIEAALVVQWGKEKVVLGASDTALMLDLKALDQLLDALHQARRDLAKVEREKITFRIPPELKDALEAKARREGLTQNAAFTEAVKEYAER